MRRHAWILILLCIAGWAGPAGARAEAGFTQATNAVNIMMKNLMDFSVGMLAFFFVGFGLMFGFHPGSTTTGDGNMGYIAVTTNLAAATGAMAAMVAARVSSRFAGGPGQRERCGSRQVRILSSSRVPPAVSA